MDNYHVHNFNTTTLIPKFPNQTITWCASRCLAQTRGGYRFSREVRCHKSMTLTWTSKKLDWGVRVPRASWIRHCIRRRPKSTSRAEGGNVETTISSCCVIFRISLSGSRQKGWGRRQGHTRYDWFVIQQATKVWWDKRGIYEWKDKRGILPTFQALYINLQQEQRHTRTQMAITTRNELEFK